MRATLSVAMIARNEEKNLPRTLEAVKWADEILIVDSGSVDRTPEIAKAFSFAARQRSRQSKVGCSPLALNHLSASSGVRG